MSSTYLSKCVHVSLHKRRKWPPALESIILLLCRGGGAEKGVHRKKRGGGRRQNDTHTHTRIYSVYDDTGVLLRRPARVLAAVTGGRDRACELVRGGRVGEPMAAHRAPRSSWQPGGSAVVVAAAGLSLARSPTPPTISHSLAPSLLLAAHRSGLLT